MTRQVTVAAELGAQVAWTALKDGTPVYDRHGQRIGVVEHVMQVGGIFEGVIVHTYPLPGRHLYAEAAQIAEIHEHGVLLTVSAAELHDPATARVSRSTKLSRQSLEARLRRAWDWITRRA